MAAYAYSPSSAPRGSWSRTKIIGLSIVAVLHVGLFTALNSGLKFDMIPKITVPIVTRLIEDNSVPKQPDPTPPKPDVRQPEVQPQDMVVPDIAVDETTNATPQALTTDSNAVSDPSTATPAKVDPNHPLTQPAYPPQSRRLGEQGSVQLLLYVLPNGHVGEARVNRSSGYPALDDAAMKEAKRAWRFVPLQSAGVATAGWVTIAVTFKLTQ